ncbi:MAG: DNA topoisomerase IB [Planctomycetia bacterium]|nr:DNA topoisomerase IB [Planctomycetia bacterium]
MIASVQNEKQIADEPEAAAKSAGLRYVDDSRPGFSRVRRGRTFEYLRPDGKSLKSARDLQRIRALAIPPAWTKRLIAFANILPRIRRRAARDLRRRNLPREKVLAAVVKLLETTLIRVGNDEYAKSNGSFGLTTMQDKHVQVKGETIRFEFRGKSGIEHEIDLEDQRLARIVRQCQDLPGQELFQYVDEEGHVCDVDSGDVNEYLREISGLDITAKDFRTWAGTALAAQALQKCEDFDSQAAAKRNITRAIERVAQRLGNTKAICRKCYVHPAIFEAYMDRSLIKLLKRRTERELRTSLADLSSEEAAVLALLQQRMQQQLTPGSKKHRKHKRRMRSPLRRTAR